MRLRTILRRTLTWAGTLTCLLVGVAWLASTRWQIWYAWSAKILMPGDVRLLGIADGGVLYRAFHCSEYDEYLIGAPGWHRAGSSGDFGFRKPALETREFRTSAWIPMWPIFTGLCVPTAILWLWPRKRTPGVCRACDYNLAGSVSGRCPECGEPT